MKKLVAVVLAIAAALALWPHFRGTQPGGKKLRLATTTSVTDSGLLKVLAPAFEQQTGYHLDVHSVGSGKAIELLKNGGADVGITHSPEAERKALEAKAIGRRTQFMQNDFVIVGPRGRAGTVAGATTAVEAMTRIAASGQTFVSRGDGSGTNQMELGLWRSAGAAAKEAHIVTAYDGMGGTLARASDEKAFTLTDRGTFLSRKGSLELVIVFQGDPALRNHYSVLEPTHRDADADGAKALAAFVRSESGRALIGSYGLDQYGESLFTPEQ